MATLTDLTTRHPALHHAAPSNTAPTQDARSD